MKNNNQDMFNPPHPGEILRDLYIQPLGLTITEAAKGLGVTRKTLSAIIISVKDQPGDGTQIIQSV